MARAFPEQMVVIRFSAKSTAGAKRLGDCLKLAEELVESYPWSDEAKELRDKLRMFIRDDLKVDWRSA